MINCISKFNRLFVCTLGLLVAGAANACAAPMTYSYSGTFDDGGTFFGSILFDDSFNAGPFDFTTTAGSVFSGFNYNNLNSTGSALGFFNGQPAVFIDNPTRSFYVFSDGIDPTVIVGDGESDKPGSLKRSITGGTAFQTAVPSTGVPEINPRAATLPLVLVGLMALMSVRRKPSAHAL